MNFDDINKIYEHIRVVVYPNVQCLWNNVSTEEILIDKYLSTIDDNRKYKLLAIPFLIDTELFLKRHKEQCIIYYNTLNPLDGLMLFIHQITPSLHIHSRLFCWIENNQVYDYITCLAFHKKDSSEAVKFIDDTFSIKCKGNTEDHRNSTGFRPIK